MLVGTLTIPLGMLRPSSVLSVQSVFESADACPFTFSSRKLKINKSSGNCSNKSNPFTNKIETNLKLPPRDLRNLLQKYLTKDYSQKFSRKIYPGHNLIPQSAQVLKNIPRSRLNFSESSRKLYPGRVLLKS